MPFGTCVRACVVRRRRTRDENADRPIDGDGNDEVTSTDFRSSKRIASGRVRRDACCAKCASVTRFVVGKSLRTADRGPSGPPRVTIDIASLDSRDPAGKLRRHAKNIEPCSPRVFSWVYHSRSCRPRGACTSPISRRYVDPMTRYWVQSCIKCYWKKIKSRESGVSFNALKK